jgi:predicted  nucleic acid-binding Zn-ribbon protein
MASIEERLQALEQEHTQLKKTIELQTIAIRALVSKEAFEKLQETVEKSQEQNSKLFDVLNNHNIFTNERLGDIQNQIEELDGKIAGWQTEMRQHFIETDGKVAGLQTEMRQHFIETATKEDMTAMEKRILNAIINTQRPPSE